MTAPRAPEATTARQSLLADRMVSFTDATGAWRFAGSAGECVFQSMQASGEMFDRALLNALDLVDLRRGQFVDTAPHIGTHAAHFARVLRRQVTVFEGNPQRAAALTQTFEDNDCAARVRLVPVAAADRSAWGWCEVDPADWRRVTSYEAMEPRGAATRVDLGAVDTYLAGAEPVSVLRVHCSDGRMAALEGARDTLHRCRPVVLATADGLAAGDILAFLSPYNYAVAQVPGVTDTFVFLNREYYRDAIDLLHARTVWHLRRQARQADPVPDEAAVLRQSAELDRLKVASLRLFEVNYTVGRDLQRASAEVAALRAQADRLHKTFDQLVAVFDSPLTQPDIARPKAPFVAFDRRVATAVKKKVSAQPRFILPYMVKKVEVDRPVRIGIASTPDRATSLIWTIQSLLDQADEICVSLNNYVDVPDHDFPDKVRFVLRGNAGERARFSFLSNEFKGYYLTCSDRIDYPSYYVDSLIQSIQRFDHRVIAGWHGRVAPASVATQATGDGEQARAAPPSAPLSVPRCAPLWDQHTGESLQISTQVMHVLDTGSLGFCAEFVRPPPEIFTPPDQTETDLALWGQQQGIPFVLVPHLGQELAALDHLRGEEARTTQDEDRANNSRAPLDAGAAMDTRGPLGDRLWQRHRPPALKRRALFLGRVSPERWVKGGIHASCVMMIRQLERQGFEVEAVDLEAPAPALRQVLAKPFDFGLVYSGDFTAQDFAAVQAVAAAEIPRSFPIYFNPSFNLDPARTAEIARFAALLPPQDGFFVFTRAAKDLLAQAVPDRPLLVVPKTIKPSDPSLSHLKTSPPAGKQIFLGDLAKLLDPSLTPTAQAWSRHLIDRFGAEAMTVVEQAKTDRPPAFLEGVKVLPHQSAILNAIKKCRVYVHLSQFCTFEMLPVEACYSGVPVVYIDMPQSLNTYIGDAGLRVTNKNELEEAVSLLMENDEAWQAYSARGILKAKSMDWQCLAFELGLSLRSHLDR